MFQSDNLESSVILSDWYLLSQKNQRLFIPLVLRSQIPIILKAGTMPLNMVTFVSVGIFCMCCYNCYETNCIVKVLKTVYSAGMLLVQSANWFISHYIIYKERYYFKITLLEHYPNFENKNMLHRSNIKWRIVCWTKQNMRQKKPT